MQALACKNDKEPLRGTLGSSTLKTLFRFVQSRVTFSEDVRLRAALEKWKDGLRGNEELLCSQIEKNCESETFKWSFLISEHVMRTVKYEKVITAE